MLTATAIAMDGLSYAAWVFVVAIGLTLIFGVMKILNVAHGAFYAFGAYGATSVIGAYLAADLPIAGAYAAMLLSALIVGVLLGLVIERGVLRRLYRRDEVILVLATYACFLILEDLLRLIWGVSLPAAYQPSLALGFVEIGRLPVTVYDLALIGLAVAVGLAAWWMLERTRYGMILAAVIHDREMAASFGVAVGRVFTITFVVGSCLGALGGAITAPVVSVTPGMGVEVIVLAFAVVAIGGMGSIYGAMLGALLVGLARAAAVHLLPEAELFVIYAVMAAVLAFRPEGLFARAKARKI